MKKSKFYLLILFGAFVLSFISCNKNEDEDYTEITGKYQLTMDGKTTLNGNSDEVGMLGNTISISNGETFAILVTSVPETNGSTIEIGDNSSGSVSITGKNLLLSDGSEELYLSISGSITRESSTKVSFEGTCTNFGDITVHTFSGSIESDIFKSI